MPASIGESLQDYAHRTGHTIEKAYPTWHAHGIANASAWSVPSRVPHADGPDHHHVIVAGGSALGLTLRDVKALAAGRY